jgi:putative hydrolase of the HAD superfamily
MLQTYFISLCVINGKLFKEVRIIFLMKEKNVSDANIKAVIFDIGGVLQIGARQKLNSEKMHSSGVHEHIAKKLGISIDQYFDAIDSVYAKSIEGSVNKSFVLKVLSCNLNYPAKKLEKMYYKYYKKIFKKNEKFFSIAKQLKKQGYKIGILSDQWHLSKEVFARKKDLKLFDDVILSCDVGMRKPQKEIYELALNNLNVSPEETIFIDNQIWNIIPANKLGIRTILYINNRKTVDQLKQYGVYIK